MLDSAANLNLNPAGEERLLGKPKRVVSYCMCDTDTQQCISIFYFVQNTFILNVHVFECISTLSLCVCACVSEYSGRGRECLLRVSQVSHLDASSCDGNRNGQKLEADTANGSLKLGGMVTSLSLSLALSMCVC